MKREVSAITKYSEVTDPGDMVQLVSSGHDHKLHICDMPRRVSEEQAGGWMDG